MPRLMVIAGAEALGQALDANFQQDKAGIAKAALYLDERSGRAERGLAVVAFLLGVYYALDLAAADPDCDLRIEAENRSDEPPDREPEL